jgi:hypothetical protein
VRFAPTLDEFSAMRPLADLHDERIAARLGQTLEEYRAELARQAQPITQPRNPHDD